MTDHPVVSQERWIEARRALLAEEKAFTRGSLDKLQAYRRRMGGKFRWVSAAASDFNFDFDVSFPKEARKHGVFYNFSEQPDPEIDELPGVSVFYREDNAIDHTYSTYARRGG
jgi:predicted dithiol-disulfide oxidoreductase (DUF899 family)